MYIIAQHDREEVDCPYTYDLIKDKWSKLPPLPCYNCTLVTISEQKQLLAIGGCKKIKDIIEVSGKVFLWDEVNKEWLEKYPSMPNTRFSCSGISHKLVVIYSSWWCNMP